MTTLNDKTVLITGGTGGIGKATAEGLAKIGAQVVIVGRDAGRGAAAVKDIQAKSGSSKVELLTADLSSQASIRQLAQNFSSRYSKLDILINNVGGMSAKREETVDGVEATFAMNHLNVLLLTHLLLPQLKASGEARIINVNSTMHRMAKLDLDDLEAKNWYRGLDVYGRAKLINLMVSYELARQLQGTGITMNIADPGGANTTMSQSMSPEMVPAFMRLILPLVKVVQAGQTTEKAAISSIYLASSPDVKGKTGLYASASGKIVQSSKASYDVDTARRLWDASLNRLGLKTFDFQPASAAQAG